MSTLLRTALLDTVVAFPTLATSPVRLAFVMTVLAVLADVAFPLSDAVMVPAAKFPAASRLTIWLAAFVLVGAPSVLWIAPWFELSVTILPEVLFAKLRSVSVAVTVPGAEVKPVST